MLAYVLIFMVGALLGSILACLFCAMRTDLVVFGQLIYDDTNDDRDIYRLVYTKDPSDIKKHKYCTFEVVRSDKKLSRNYQSL